MRAFTILAALAALAAAQSDSNDDIIVTDKENETNEQKNVAERTYAPMRYGDFDYSEGGANWSKQYPDSECAFEQQGGSPINIPTEGKFVTETNVLGHKFYKFAQTSLAQWYKPDATAVLQAAVDMRVHMMSPEAIEVISMGHTRTWMDAQNKAKKEVEKAFNACLEEVTNKKAYDLNLCEDERKKCDDLGEKIVGKCKEDENDCKVAAENKYSKSTESCEKKAYDALDSLYPQLEDDGTFPWLNQNYLFSEALRDEVEAWQDVTVAVVDDTLEKEHKVVEDLGPNEVGTQGYGVLPTDIRIHTPAEHQIDGVKHDVELQIYGKELRGCGCDGNKIYEMFATSILFECVDCADGNGSGDDNELIKALLDLWTETQKEEKDLTDGLDLGELLPDSTGVFYHYVGSLTTPPCTAGVAWYVLADPQPISKSQLEKLREYTTTYSMSASAASALQGGVDSGERPNDANKGQAGNNRQIQPMDGAIQVYKSVLTKSGASALYTGAAATLAVITALAF